MNSQQPIEVELTWIRHGESCSNLISTIYRQYFQEANKGKPKEEQVKKEIQSYVANPHLSNFGISHIHSLKQQSTFYPSFTPDLIVCSQLIRTMETAYLLFYDKLRSANSNSLLSKFFISPYITEFESSLHYEIPHSPQETLQRFHQFQTYLSDAGLYPVKELKLDYIRKNPEPNQTNLFKNASSINSSTWLKDYFKPSSDPNNYELFIQQILPLLIQKVLSKEPSKKKIEIAVVCHANYIQRHVTKTLRFNYNSTLGKYVKEKEFTVDENVHIFYSPPKNADAYLEKYILTPGNPLEREDDYQIVQRFPEQVDGIPHLPPGQVVVERDKMVIPQFDKYDLFPFLFFPELGNIPFNIKNRMNVTRILKLIESKLGSRYTNFNYQDQLNNNHSDLWKKILGLCHIEQLVSYYKTDYNRRPEPLKNPENSMEGGKKKMKKTLTKRR